MTATGTMGTLAGTRLASVPPWVWLWIALFVGSTLPWAVPYIANAAMGNTEAIAQAEQQLAEMQAKCRAGADSIGLSPAKVCGGGRIPVLDIVSLWLPVGMDAAPYLVLSAGVLLSFIPAIARRRNLDERGATPISDDYPSSVVQAVRGEVNGLRLALEPMECLARQDITAMVCPLSYRRSAVLIGGALPPIWRRAPEVGRGILAHEMTHWRQGEGWLIDVGSPLVDALRFIPALTIICLVLPMLLGLANSVVDVLGFASTMNAKADQWNALADSMHLSGSRLLHIGLAEIAGHFATQFLTLRLPGMAIMIAGWICIVLWMVASLVGAFWTAEFTADRAAARFAPEAYADAMARTHLSQKRMDRIKDFLLHPPTRLRCLAARHTASPWALTALLLLFPASLIAASVPMLAWKWFERFSPALMAGIGNVSLADTAAWLPGGTAEVSHWLAVPLLLCGATVICWPILAPIAGRAVGLASHRGEPVVPYVAVGSALLGLGSVL